VHESVVHFLSYHRHESSREDPHTTCAYVAGDLVILKGKDDVADLGRPQDLQSAPSATVSALRIRADRRAATPYPT